VNLFFFIFIKCPSSYFILFFFFFFFWGGVQIFCPFSEQKNWEWKSLGFFCFPSVKFQLILLSFGEIFLQFFNIIKLGEQKKKP
jgi:hypothetical protein